jgi:hypothetical protein
VKTSSARNPPLERLRLSLLEELEELELELELLPQQADL